MWHSQKRRTESTERGKTAKSCVLSLPPTFARNPEAAPRLALRADKKRPEQSLVFEFWWPVAESNHGHADFQSVIFGIYRH